MIKYFMILTIIEGVPPAGVQKNVVTIQMFTSSSCPPCNSTKLLLFGHEKTLDAKAKYLKENMLNLFCFPVYSNTPLFSTLIKFLNGKKELANQFYSLALQTIENFKNKKTDTIPVQIVNLTQTIMTKTHMNQVHNPNKEDISLFLNETSVQELVYLGFVITIIGLKWTIFLTDVNTYGKEAEAAGVYSIPFFIFSYNSANQISHSCSSLGSIGSFIQLNELLARLFFTEL